MAWLILFGCLVLAATAMLSDLGRLPITDAREAEAVATAVQTWRRQQQFAGESWSYQRLAPYRDGLAQLADPPARTWLHLAAIGSMSQDSSLEQVVYRTRLVSVVFVLLAIAAVFWAGMSIGGMVTASMAGLICLSQPIVLSYGRLATDDAIQLGLSVLSIAAALWAIRPLRPAAPLVRQGIGWGVCGLSLGAVALTGGPGAMPTVLVAIVVMLLLVQHRVGHVLGLVAALLITALMVTPWAGYAHLQQPDAWRSWMMPLLPRPGDGLGDLAGIGGQRIGWIFIGVAPWTLWLLAAMIQPFSTSSEGSRNRLFIGWAWFASVAVLLAFMPGDLMKRSLLPALLAGSVLTGQLIRHGADLSAQGRHARFWRWLRWPQWSLMLAISLLLPAVGLFQQTLIDSNYLAMPIFADMHALFWVGFAIVLVGIAAVSLRFVLGHFPARAVVCWAMWSLVLVGVVTIPLSRGPAAQTTQRVNAQLLASIITNRPVIYLTDAPRPDAVMMFYTDRVFAPLTMPQLRKVTEEGLDLFLLAPQQIDPGQPWLRLHEFAEQQLTLWRCIPPPPVPEIEITPESAPQETLGQDPP